MADTGSARVRVDRRMYLTEDRERAVPDGHPDARFLLCTPGDEMPRADALRYGLLAPPEAVAEPEPEPEPEPEVEPEVEPEPEVEAKQAAPTANKARRPASNKGA